MAFDVSVAGIEWSEACPRFAEREVAVRYAHSLLARIGHEAPAETTVTVQNDAGIKVYSMNIAEWRLANKALAGEADAAWS